MRGSSCRLQRQNTSWTITGLSLVLVAVMGLVTSEAQATSITGQFQIDGTVLGETFSVGNKNAGTHPGGTHVSDGGDFIYNLPNGAATVYVNWLDPDTFVVKIENFDTSLNPDSFSVDLTLKSLTFAGGETISSVTFNPTFNPGPGDNTYIGFFASPANPTGASPVNDPAVTVGPSQIHLVYGSDWGLNNGTQLIADAPPLYFDVTTKGPVATPEPGMVALLCCGLVVLGLTRRYALRSIE